MKIKLRVVGPYASHDGPVGWTVQRVGDDYEANEIICESRTRKLAVGAMKQILALISEVIKKKNAEKEKP